MDELPGKQVKCTRRINIVLNGFKNLDLKVPASFESPVPRQDGFVGIKQSDGYLRLINQDFIVEILVHPEVESDMEIK